MKPAQNEPSRQQPPTTARRASPRQSVLERIAAGLISAVFVCRLLTPTDAAATGETLWIAQFALLAFLVWAFTVWRAGELRLAFDGLDVAVSLVCLGHVAGALVVVATSGDKRAAMTMLWEWVGLWITSFLMRRLVRPADRQGLLLVLASTALVLAGLGVWQHHFGFDESRRTYEELKERLAALERSGRPSDPAAALDWDRSLSSVRSDFVQMNIPADDSARMMWEQRLYSVEPIGLFALANTLAGVLVVAAIACLGGLISNDRPLGRTIVAVGGILTLLIVYCLLLTKSRTAWVGLAVGLAAWGMVSGLARFETIRRFRRYLAAGTAVVVALIAVAFASGGLDRLVVSESMKSLRYRFQYWTGTCRMLFNSPQSALLGVGPGNFRQHYLEFKLPESSEEIADPHNLVLDVWANGGLIAVAGLAGIGFLVIRALLRGHQENPRGRDGVAVHDQAAGAAAPEKLWSDGIVLGGAGAFLIALFLGLADEVSLLFMLAAWLVFVYVCGPIFRRDLPRVVPAAACVALIVHLAGAGGIGMPAVAQILLLLAILAIPAGDATTDARDRPPAAGSGKHRAHRPASVWICQTESRGPVALIGLLGIALYMMCWFLGLMPVITVRRLMASGIEALFQRGRPTQGERDFRLAADFDTWSSSQCERLAELEFQHWLAAERDLPEVFDRCLAWQQSAIARDPRNPAGYRALGEFYLSKASRGGDSADAAAAAGAFRRAAELYPNHAVTQAQLAEALQAANEPEAARQAAARAFELDGINERAGHVDKRLPPARSRTIGEILRQDSN